MSWIIAARYARYTCAVVCDACVCGYVREFVEHTRFTTICCVYVENKSCNTFKNAVRLGKAAVSFDAYMNAIQYVALHMVKKLTTNILCLFKLERRFARNLDDEMRLTINSNLDIRVDIGETQDSRNHAPRCSIETDGHCFGAPRLFA